jgi:hypothetical protein
MMEAFSYDIPVKMSMYTYVFQVCAAAVVKPEEEKVEEDGDDDDDGDDGGACPRCGPGGTQVEGRQGICRKSLCTHVLLILRRRHRPLQLSLLLNLARVKLRER